MNIRQLLVGACMLAAAVPAMAQDDVTYLPPRGKEVYIPKELKRNDFTKESSKWSYARMAHTNDVVIFWEKPFGNVLSKAPELEGKDMRVDINNLQYQLQRFYNYYRDSLKFILPGSKAEKYRMMVMLNYSLEGTAYGGDYDGTIGALWTAPNRIQDQRLNCIAHELGHSFQSQIIADGTGEAWGGGGIFEMTSQWMLWQVNHEWTTDENYHWKGFIDNHHLRFLHGENIYHSPYVLEYWSMKRGKPVIADLFRAGKKGEGPAQTYMRMFNLTLDEMNDEMADCYARLITFDFPRVKRTHKKFPVELVSKVVDDPRGGKHVITNGDNRAPQTWGFNVVAIEPNEGAKKFDLEFTGLNNDANAQYKTVLVEVDLAKNATYSEIHTGQKTKFSQKTRLGCEYYLVIVGCPKKTYEPYLFNPYSQEQPKEEATFPYKIVVK